MVCSTAASRWFLPSSVAHPIDKRRPHQYLPLQPRRRSSPNTVGSLHLTVLADATAPRRTSVGREPSARPPSAHVITKKRPPDDYADALSRCEVPHAAIQAYGVHPRQHRTSTRRVRTRYPGKECAPMVPRHRPPARSHHEPFPMCPEPTAPPLINLVALGRTRPREDRKAAAQLIQALDADVADLDVPDRLVTWSSRRTPGGDRLGPSVGRRPRRYGLRQPRHHRPPRCGREGVALIRQRRAPTSSPPLPALATPRQCPRSPDCSTPALRPAAGPARPCCAVRCAGRRAGCPHRCR
ncbi:hypothetical protein T45_02832 [Streptomyces turgidiscabies]|nr:hypothetical protein T45_02832 [Streptomyces turgidiscabies]